MSEQEYLETESGVESSSGDGEWCTADIAVALDLTTEQVQETLKYFTLSSDRTNQMTKTHNDLDAILLLLQEKEKDLEMAARIGQSLLERNKSLMHKTEVMEKYLGENSDREEQLRHDIVRKNDLLQKFLMDQEDMFLETDNKSEEESRSSDSASINRDDSFNTLQDKCHMLEQQNTRFILDALHLKEQTASEEQRERQLITDCVQQLIEAKDHITQLTDDISGKAEDNVRQQEEISQLINTVVDLQKQHSQLSVDNEELQSMLNVSQAGQDQLKTKIDDLQDKYHECFEILMENQQEMRSLNQRMETPRPKQSSPSSKVARDSIAREIEQSVKRDLADIQEKRQNLARVLQTVRNINVSKGKQSKKVPKPSSSGGSSSTGFKFNPVTDLPRPPSDTSLDGGDDGSSASGLDSRHSYARRSFRKPEKLQIVKPIKGSVTLQQWKKLASPSMKLEEQRPGVHVKGDVQSCQDGQSSREHSDISDMDDVEEDEPIQIKMRPKPQEPPPPTKPPQDSSISNALASLGIQANRHDSTSSSILAQLLNSPSASTPAKSSVGQLLAEVLQKASNEASSKEPKRAESLRNLANYFSEKEKAGKSEPETIPEDDSPPVSPPTYTPAVLPSTAATGLGGVGGILSRMLAGSSGIGVGLPTPRPISTVAGLSSTSITTSSTSLLSQTGFARTSSGTNLKSLNTVDLNAPDKRLSLDATNLMSAAGSFHTNDASTTSFPNLRRRASSGDLETLNSTTDLSQGVGLGTRLYRSSSSGSLNDLSQLNDGATEINPGGFFGRLTRRPSLGSLTDLVQKSNLATIPIPPQGRIERASSFDSGMVSRPSQSPPSPSHFDTNRSFFPTKTEASKGFFSGRKLSSLAGVRGMWSQGPSSSTSQGDLPQVPLTNKSEERLEKINKAFTFEDFGGMGLMSFFGNRKSEQPNK